MFLVSAQEICPPYTRRFWHFMALIIWCFPASCGTLEGGEGKRAGLREGGRGKTLTTYLQSWVSVRAKAGNNRYAFRPNE